MNTYDKPPLGVSPHWFVYHQRMKELNDSIGNYLEYAHEHHCTIDTRPIYELIENWAKEIVWLASLEAELEKQRRDT